METIMDDSQVQTLEQVRKFLEGTGAIELAISSKSERYDWVRRLLQVSSQPTGSAASGDGSDRAPAVHDERVCAHVHA